SLFPYTTLFRSRPTSCRCIVPVIVPPTTIPAMTRRLAVRRTILSAVIATVACGSGDAGVPVCDAAALRSTNTCDVREGGSRWAPPGGRYAPVAGAEYGRNEGEELADVWGLAATAGTVFILDGGNSRVVKLDAGLRLVRTFGREGKGPGEFAYQRISALTAWAAADDSALYIMDVRGVSEFDPSGGFRRYVGMAFPFSIPRGASRRGTAASCIPWTASTVRRGRGSSKLGSTSRPCRTRSCAPTRCRRSPRYAGASSRAGSATRRGRSGPCTAAAPSSLMAPATGSCASTSRRTARTRCRFRRARSRRAPRRTRRGWSGSGR